MSKGVAYSSLALQVGSKSAFRILPAGQFKAVDGRPAGGSWTLSPQQAAIMVAEAASKPIPYMIDYEHQSMQSDKNGQPVPAAGWFKQLEWRSDGLYTTDATWTDKAKAMLDSGEYRFISPVFAFDPQTLVVQRLVSVALTNQPALPTLTDFAALRAQEGVVLSERDREVLGSFAASVGMTLDGLSSQARCQELEQRLGDTAQLTEQQAMHFEAVFGFAPGKAA